jgi:hypothetical protein
VAKCGDQALMQVETDCVGMYEPGRGMSYLQHPRH